MDLADRVCERTTDVGVGHFGDGRNGSSRDASEVRYHIEHDMAFRITRFVSAVDFDGEALAAVRCEPQDVVTAHEPSPW